MGDGDIVSTDDLMAAFRKKKEEAARAAEAKGDDAPEPKPVATEPTPPVPEPKKEPDPDPEPISAPATPPKPEFSPSPRGPVPGAKPVPEPDPAPIPEPEPILEPIPVPEPVKESSAPVEPEPTVERASEPSPTEDVPVQKTEPTPTPEPVSEPEPKPEPSAETRDVDFKSSPKAAQSKPKADPVVDAAHRPTSPAVGTGTLAPLDPGLGLAARLQKDALVSRPGWAIWRYIAHGALAVGLALLLLDRYMAIVEGNVLVGPIRLTWLALALTILAAGAIGALWTLAKDRNILLNFESSQADEWVSAEFRVKLLVRIRLGGLVAIAAALLFGLLYSFIQPYQNKTGLLVVMFGVAGIAAMVVIVVHFIHKLAVRNYIQTTVLWILERTGVAGGTASTTDARVPAVLKSLDGLLAQLPDSAIQSFMQTPEAKSYVELLESLKEP